MILFGKKGAVNFFSLSIQCIAQCVSNLSNCLFNLRKKKRFQGFNHGNQAFVVHNAGVLPYQLNSRGASILHVEWMT